jgi:hypothetical protein
MVKESKFFRKQAERAERMAQAVSDAEISQSFMNMAKAYRSQVDMLRPRSRRLRKSPAKSGANIVACFESASGLIRPVPICGEIDDMSGAGQTFARGDCIIVPLQRYAFPL